MKTVNINVDFVDPIKKLKEELQRSGARNIDIRRSYNDEIEVRYTIKVADPEKSITNLLNQAGAKNVRANTSYSGARFECKVDDMIDEHEFKRRITDVLRRSGYRSY